MSKWILIDYELLVDLGIPAKAEREYLINQNRSYVDRRRVRRHVRRALDQPLPGNVRTPELVRWWRGRFRQLERRCQA